jgi:hypothetical protein
MIYNREEQEKELELANQNTNIPAEALRLALTYITQKMRIIIAFFSLRVKDKTDAEFIDITNKLIVGLRLLINDEIFEFDDFRAQFKLNFTADFYKNFSLNLLKSDEIIKAKKRFNNSFRDLRLAFEKDEEGYNKFASKRPALNKLIQTQPEFLKYYMTTTSSILSTHVKAIINELIEAKNLKYPQYLEAYNKFAKPRLLAIAAAKRKSLNHIEEKDTKKEGIKTSLSDFFSEYKKIPNDLNNNCQPTNNTEKIAKFNKSKQ